MLLYVVDRSKCFPVSLVRGLTYPNFSGGCTKTVYSASCPLQSTRNLPDSLDMSSEFRKLSGEGVWSCRTKCPVSTNQGQCPAKSFIFAGHFTVKCPARIQDVQWKTACSPDKMSGEAQINFAYSATWWIACEFSKPWAWNNSTLKTLYMFYFSASLLVTRAPRVTRLCPLPTKYCM